LDARKGLLPPRLAFPLKTLRNWEQRRRRPNGPARILLAMLKRDPWLVFDVFNDQHRTPLAQFFERKISRE
jgi:putative transcriptional regulator